jgi:hypothetical protein
MAEYRRFPRKSPLDILTTLITGVTTNEIFFVGSIVSNIINDENRANSEFGIRLTTGIPQLIKRLSDAAVLDYSIQLRYSDGSPTRYKLGIMIQNVSFGLNVTIKNPLNEYCDFTHDNIKMKIIEGDQEKMPSMGLLYSDPTGKSDAFSFYAKCLDDIRNHRLVPMCPDDILTITQNSKPYQRRAFIILLGRALEFLSKGWTLHPSLNGKSLTYTLYSPTEDPPKEEAEKCSICMDNLLPHQITNDANEVKPIDRPIDVIHRNNVAKNANKRKVGAKSRVKSADEGVLSEDISYTNCVTPLTLVCGHSYHLRCITHLMLEEGPTSYKCPLCQKEILFSGNFEIPIETTNDPGAVSPTVHPRRQVEDSPEPEEDEDDDELGDDENYE